MNAPTPDELKAKLATIPTEDLEMMRSVIADAFPGSAAERDTYMRWIDAELERRTALPS